MLEELAQFGIDLQTNRKAAEKAIDTAVRKKKVQVVKYLLESGLHQEAYIGRGLLHHRSALHRADMVSLLLQHGVDPNEQGLYKVNSPLTTLYSISRKYRPDTAKILLENGADPNALSVSSTSPLLIVVEQIKRGYESGSSRLEDMKELLEYGADPNYRAEGGRRVLHEVLKVYNGSSNSLNHDNVQEYVKTLLQYGANPDLEDAHGVSARKYTQQRASSNNLSKEELATWQTLLELMTTHFDD